VPGVRLLHCNDILPDVKAIDLIPDYWVEIKSKSADGVIIFAPGAVNQPLYDLDYFISGFWWIAN
jgi:hypothetical protein